MPASKTPALDVKRRKFLAGAIAAGPAVGLAAAGALNPAAAADAAAPQKSSVPPTPNMAGETGTPGRAKITVDHAGSDFMVDVIKTLNVEYLCAVPGSSFRGLQESLINYGKNQMPEWVTCLHEDSSVAMAHGYAKAAGKPLISMVHANVGLQHAPMAIYNAFADQAPVVIIAGNTEDGAKRRLQVDWYHSAHDQAAIVRDFTKWDDQPDSLQAFSESMVRAYSVATAVPSAPTLIVANADLMEGEVDPAEAKTLTIPKLKEYYPPQGDMNAIAEAAKMLANAQNPVIIADRFARTFDGMALLVKLAETLNAPVIDRRHRLNFPSRHPLNHSSRGGAALRDADVILALEPIDLFGLTVDLPDLPERRLVPRVKAGTKVICISTAAFLTKTNMAAYQRFAAADLMIAGDSQASLPALTDAIARELSGNQKSRAQARGKNLGDMMPAVHKVAIEDAAYGWDATPISTARMCMELYDQIKHEDWVLASDTGGISDWPIRLWDFDKPYRFLGGSGAAGVGYSSPAAVGIALANKKLGRLTVAIVGDGDYLMQPGCIWTAAQSKIPLLMIVHNNRAYHQEMMHVQRMADQRSRGIDRCEIGCVFTEPFISYAKLAQGFGVYTEGPVDNAGDFRSAVRRALEVVKKGEPALIDCISQAR